MLTKWANNASYQQQKPKKITAMTSSKCLFLFFSGRDTQTLKQQNALFYTISINVISWIELGLPTIIKLIIFDT